MSYGTVQAEKMTTESGYSLGAGNASSFKNRIINGAMVIDQRNAGAAVSSHLAFPVDRFMMVKDTPAGSFTAQQSTVAPAGFTNSLLYTVGTAFTPSSGQNNFFRQSIEGFNIADLGWGTANAKPVTLSFWVRSSLTGTFGGSLRNGASNRSFPFSYVISSADTFEYKTITIAGDTSGTWLTNNGTGIELAWGVSVGSNFSNTAGSWYSGNFISVTGAVNLTSTAGATLYITGVQLEVGTVATSFETRSYGTELLLCQRYCEVWRFITGTIDRYAIGVGFNDQLIFQCIVQKRAAATVTVTGNAEIRDTTNAQRLIGSVVGATDRSFQFSLTSTPAVAAVGTLRFPTGNTDAVIISSEL